MATTPFASFVPCSDHGDECKHVVTEGHHNGDMYDCPGCEGRCHCDFEGPENIFTEDDASEACVYCGSNADLSHTEVYPPDMDMHDVDSYGVPETDVFDGL